MALELKQVLAKRIGGYWDGGPKDTFYWSIEKHHRWKDKKGSFVRVGSWGANHWFSVAEGKTDRQTLANAKRHLQASARRSGIKCTFSYVDR